MTEQPQIPLSSHSLPCCCHPQHTFSLSKSKTCVSAPAISSTFLLTELGEGKEEGKPLFSLGITYFGSTHFLLSKIYSNRLLISNWAGICFVCQLSSVPSIKLQILITKGKTEQWTLANNCLSLHSAYIV